MVTVEPFTADHLRGFSPQAHQAPELVGALAAGAEHGPSFVAVDESGRVLCIAGLAVNHPRWATAWAVFSEDKGGRMVAVTRAIRRVLQEALATRFDRLDMHVRAGFDRAADFACLLGFDFEATLKRAAPDGGDLLLFSRISLYRGRA